MHLKGSRGLAHLAYCTNIHPGETWPEVRAALRRHLPEVKRRISRDAPMGVGLRLSAEAAAALAYEPDELAELRDFLDTHGLYVFTLNGFPYGRFHGARVKEEVYQPDWCQPERLAYTNRLANLLAGLMPAHDPELTGSVSTAPGGFRSLAGAPGAEAEVADALLRHAAHLHALRERTGRTIALAIEPEPMCLMETVEEAARFFEQHLFSYAGVARLATLAGITVPAAEEVVRRHLGLCYDVCHAAVEFETPEASLARLRRSGISVAKLQLSSALRIPRVNAAAIERLRPYDEGVYLHQVVERRAADGRLVRYRDLADAFAAFDREPEAGAREWRVHFHVPVFHDNLDAFATTQAELREILERQRHEMISSHLEVETYTWDVLPPDLRRSELSEAIARELTWVRERLGA
ncbi:metabolite traffic protein EboE [Roseicella aquatilis]|uniref:Sugar phosphate isomerase n=1 Tax=Roseicella aquatilis TaxID=2527868 RepID=A0A4R4D645_9PROT|nr:metabolite traffic protein EboE [Roseicella aquatilis]TCZ54240.1 sugar phosphate isomerase [Roseicella aquatilis]